MTYRWSAAPLQALPLGPHGLLDLGERAGLDTVGLRATRVTTDDPYLEIVADPACQESLRAHAAQTVPVNDLEIARLDPETEAADLLPLLRATAALGARAVVTQLPDPNRTRRIDRFGELCDLAAPLGVRCEIEFLPWTPTRGLDEAADIVGGAGRPNGGILVDLIHFHRSGSSIDRLRELPQEWFKVLHLNDAPAQIPADDAGLIHAARHHRLLPGEGAVDIAGILATLPDGLTIAVEVPNDAAARRHGVEGWALEAIARSRAWVEQNVRTDVSFAKDIPGGLNVKPQS